tara:strand:- start:3 stop:305 length:303 start_codon:yes stop_codon:yes gene_type:complete
MKDTMTVFSFCEWFRKSENRKNQFSFEGLKALYEHLTNLEEDIGEEIEFDPIALCCDYSEYENLKELKNNYSDIENFEDLESNTSVIQIPTTERFIIQNF